MWVFLVIQGPASFYLVPRPPLTPWTSLSSAPGEAGVEEAYLFLELLGLEMTHTTSTLFHWWDPVTRPPLNARDPGKQSSWSGGASWQASRQQVRPRKEGTELR